MEENAQGAVELNNIEQTKREIEEATRKLNEIKSKLDTLEFPKGFKPISISKYKELKLSEQINERDIIGIEIENEEQERQILLYKKLEEERLSLIATINEKNEAVLSEEYKQRYKGYIRERDLEKPYPVEQERMEEQKEAELKADEKEADEKEIDEQDENTNQKTAQEIAIAKALGVSPNQIVSVVEIKDSKTMSNVLNKNVKKNTLYAVKLKQGSKKIGTNTWAMVNDNGNGSYEKAMREYPSDTMQDLAQTLGIRPNEKEATIHGKEVSATSKTGKGKVHVELNRYRFSNGTTYVLEVDNREHEADLHIYKEQDGKLEPLCTAEHGEHESEKIELPDRTLDVEEKEEEEERTPGGDAYKRRYS